MERRCAPAPRVRLTNRAGPRRAKLVRGLQGCGTIARRDISHARRRCIRAPCFFGDPRIGARGSNAPRSQPPSLFFQAHLASGAHFCYLETWNSRDPKLWPVSLHYPHIRAITYIVTNDRGRWGVLSRFVAGPTTTDTQLLAANSEAGVLAARQYFTAWNGHDAQSLAAAQHYPFVRIGDGAVEVSASIEEFLARDRSRAASGPGSRRGSTEPKQYKPAPMA